jgi:preprotein translocase subunit YajC
VVGFKSARLAHRTVAPAGRNDVFSPSRGFRPADFGLLSGFGLRISDFKQPNSGPYKKAGCACGHRKLCIGLAKCPIFFRVSPLFVMESMRPDNLNVILAMAPTSGGANQSQAPWYLQMFPFVLLIVVFYVAMIRPQQKKAKEHAKLLSNLKSGDEVVTSSGLVGTIITVKDRTVTLRTADSKLELLKSAITDIVGATGNSKS